MSISMDTMTGDKAQLLKEVNELKLEVPSIFKILNKGGQWKILLIGALGSVVAGLVRPAHAYFFSEMLIVWVNIISFLENEFGNTLVYINSVVDLHHRWRTTFVGHGIPVLRVHDTRNWRGHWVFRWRESLSNFLQCWWLINDADDIVKSFATTFLCGIGLGAIRFLGWREFNLETTTGILYSHY